MVVFVIFVDIVIFFLLVKVLVVVVIIALIIDADRTAVVCDILIELSVAGQSVNLFIFERASEVLLSLLSLAEVILEE